MRDLSRIKLWHAHRTLWIQMFGLFTVNTSVLGLKCFDCSSDEAEQQLWYGTPHTCFFEHAESRLY